ncbi:hypothetical protein INT45_001539 [Circinella minor]|uniref:Reticulon-like protein n=1 Tax=Circinella minor TaxID=1195481 RepID=A0A8H7RY38_9FUNG|nr:hypothetical protein INT45_001539 [Circinella minor]
MEAEIGRRPVTPPEENPTKRKKSEVLADLNENKYNPLVDEEPNSVRSAKPFAHNTAKTHDAAGLGKTNAAKTRDDPDLGKTNTAMNHDIGGFGKTGSTMKHDITSVNDPMITTDTLNHTTTSSTKTKKPMTYTATTTQSGFTHDFTKDQDDLAMQRNDVTRRIERDVYAILQWENPVRSGITLVAIVGSILLTQSYSLLQLGAALLTVAIGLNLVYVTFVVQTQKVFSESTEPVHPYRGVFGNKERLTTVDKRMVHHYSSLFVDISETLIRALARIVFIEDMMTSLKWFGIFYVTWGISAHVSSRSIILFFVISAFIFPRLYMSNKGIVDSHLMHGEAIIKEHVNNAQEFAKDNMDTAYAKTRAYFAKAGTSGTDAKNSISNTSASLKKVD